ncbi:G patch domain and ankyrin repeat-containing protein 1 [Sphaeramia orbicularis]|uniref:G patch domain and ankyrin repeat-containing protein 1 n=1 Tax=Sphaeramia orbicularis TaxID=375764 RepID=UPI00117FCD1C|nr:G patch domain and ankyrin repeat-containing protein 1 [Sphaeramia orbicularis]XP_029995922.1 G patch domain and ankyrin repeat-containing protein 1 [Sphaeramia orbicularis]
MTTLGFTPASEQDVFRIEKTNQHRSPTASTLSGEEARQFYENLMKDGDGQAASRSADGRECQTRQMNRESSRSQRRRRRRVRAAEIQRSQTVSVVDGRVSREADSIQSRDLTPREMSNSERSAELQGLRLLRCAHEGDISGLKELLSNGVDINFQDTFLWTAIMCASWSGQRGAVKLLLQQGAAWVGVVDMQGRDAKDLAMEAGHSGVLEELESYGESQQRETQADNSAPQSHWCDVCCNEYSSDLSSHLSSTVHQFSLRRPPPTPYYCLPPSSNSYKMMVRCGWKPGTGLGPEGEGPKQPVSTVLKRDQKGLGYGQTKRAKVTHFQARDHEAVKTPSERREERAGKGQRKEEGRRKEQRDRNWERDFRTSFYL